MKTSLEVHQAVVEDFLEYTPPEIKSKIDALKEDPRRAHVLGLIQAGDWKTFLDKYRKEPDAYYILLATYCHPVPEKHLLTEDEFGTAYYFLAAAIDDPDYVISEMGVYQREDAKLPENCRYRIGFHPHLCPAILQQSIKMWIDRSDIKLYSKLMIRNNDGSLYYLKSIPEVKRDNNIPNNSPIRLVLGISSRRAYWKDIQNHKTQVSLLTPDMCQNICIHGTPAKENGGIAFSIAHDFAHCVLSFTYKNHMVPQKIQVVNALLDILDQREPLPQQIEENLQTPILPMEATIDTLTTKCLDELVSSLITSEEQSNDYIDDADPNKVIKRYSELIGLHGAMLVAAQRAYGSNERACRDFSMYDCVKARRNAVDIIKPIVESAYPPKNASQHSLIK